MTSDTFRQEVYSQNSEQVLIVLLTINHNDFDEPIYISSDPYEALPELGENIRGCVSNGNTFIFIPFEISLPRDDATGTVSAKLTLSNVDQRIVAQARSVNSPMSVKIQVVLSNDVDFIELEYDNFKLTNIGYDSMNIEGGLTLDYWGLEPFPSGRFTPSEFPGLF